MNFVRTIFFILSPKNLILLVLFSTNLFAIENRLAPIRQIVVLYDLSGGVHREAAENLRAMEYVGKIINTQFSENDVFSDDELVRDQFKFIATKWNYPLYNPEGNDRISIFGFGIDQRFRSQDDQYIDLFKDTFFTKLDVQNPQDVSSHLENLIKQSYDYDLFDYVYPLVLTELYKENRFNQRLLFIVFSDFPVGDNQFKDIVQGDQKSTFKRLKALFENYFFIKNRYDLQIKKIVNRDSTDQLGQVERIFPLRAFEIIPSFEPKIGWGANEILIKQENRDANINIGGLSFTLTGFDTTMHDIEKIDLDIMTTEGESFCVQPDIKFMFYSMDSLKFQAKYYQIEDIEIPVPEGMRHIDKLQFMLRMNLRIVPDRSLPILGVNYGIRSDNSPVYAIIRPQTYRELKISGLVFLGLGIIALILYGYFKFYDSHVRFYFDKECKKKVPESYHFLYSNDALCVFYAKFIRKKGIFFWAKNRTISYYFEEIEGNLLSIEHKIVLPSKESQHQIKDKGETIVKLELKIGNHNVDSDDKYSGSFNLYHSIKSENSNVVYFRYSIAYPKFQLDVKQNDLLLKKDIDVDLGDHVAILTAGVEYPIDFSLSVSNYDISDICQKGTLPLKIKVARAKENVHFIWNEKKWHILNIKFLLGENSEVLEADSNSIFINGLDMVGKIKIDNLAWNKEKLGLPDEKSIKVARILVESDILKIYQNEQTVNVFNYAIKPDFGSYWISLDPGTTGSCIGGFESGDDDVMMGTFGEENLEIVPSLCYIHPNKGYCYGYEAQTYLDNIGEGKMFSSIKKLIGYDYKEKLKIVDQTKMVDSETVATNINTYLISQFIESKIAEKTPKEVNSIILSVPNSFSQNKINLFKSCIPDALVINGKTYAFPRTRHIHEAEAISIFLWKERKNEIQNKTILLCDFGGGTINIAVVSVDEPKQDSKIKVIVDMHARIGCSVGGDTVTQNIAEKLWSVFLEESRGNLMSKEKNNDTFVFNPFNHHVDYNTSNPDVIKERAILKRELYTIAEGLKIELNLEEQKKKSGVKIPKYLTWQDLQDMFSNKTTLKTVDHTLNISNTPPDSPYIETEGFLQRVLAGEGDNNTISYYNVALELIDDALSLAGNIKVDKILFSGRSSQLVGLRDKIIHSLHLNAEHIIDLKGENLKTCVSKGAVYYISSLPGSIEFIRNKAYSHYIAELPQIHAPKRVKLIHAYSTFPETQVIEDSKKLDFDMAGNLDLFMVMGDPEKAKAYKKEKIYRFHLGTDFGNSGDISYSLDKDYFFDATLSGNGAVKQIDKKKFIKEELVLDELAEKSASWYLV